jgi:hypothetical protein
MHPIPSHTIELLMRASLLGARADDPVSPEPAPPSRRRGIGLRRGARVATRRIAAAGRAPLG